MIDDERAAGLGEKFAETDCTRGRVTSVQIARPFFERADGSATPQRAKQVLAELRSQVMSAAERLRAEDVSAGDGERGARRVAIVKLHYFDGVSMHDVA